MKERSLPTIIVNPTLQPNNQSLFALFDKYDWIPHYYPIKMTGIESQIVPSHPVFRFNKPQRVSKKTGQTKPEAMYFAVFNPVPIGAGSFADVCPVIGVWKLSNGHWVFKIQSDPNKELLVKTNALRTKLDNAIEVKETYQTEYTIGQWVQHMGYKYPPVTYQSYSFLFMYKQQGVSLTTIITKLRANPNHISIMDRLKITTNLLKALDTQISGITIPSKNDDDEAYLVHRDIKPDNIIVNVDWSVKFIDYGFAQKSTQRLINSGTPLYMDPKLLDESQKHADDVSDLASLSRVIAELWGDRSGIITTSLKEVQYRNLHNVFVNFLEGISGLTPTERTTLSATIEAMTSYEETNRIRADLALEQFEQLLVERTIKDNEHILQLSKKSIHELDADELLLILKSIHLNEFLKRFKTAPEIFSLVTDKIKYRLLELNEATLNLICPRYLNVAHIDLSLFLIHHEHISAHQLSLILKLGVISHESALKHWVHFVNEKGQEFRWASICRVLYQATLNADAIIAKIPHGNTFKSIYCRLFLVDKDLVDDATNARLVLRHIAITEAYQRVADDIEEKLNHHFKNTSFAEVILSGIKNQRANQRLMIHEDTHVLYIRQQIRRLNQCFHTVNQLAIFNSMDMRATAINSLQELIHQIKNLNPMDWSGVPTEKITALEVRGRAIMGLDVVYNRLQNYSHLEILPDLFLELDQYYQDYQFDLNVIHDQCDRLIRLFDQLQLINTIRTEMSLKGCSFSKDSVIETHFIALIRRIRFKNVHEFNDTLIDYKGIYSNCYSLFESIRSSSSNTSALIDKVHLLLIKVLPDESIAKSMQQIEEQAADIPHSPNVKSPKKLLARFSFLNKKKEPSQKESSTYNFYA